MPDDEASKAWQTCECCDNVTGEHLHDAATCTHVYCPGWDVDDDEIDRICETITAGRDDGH